MKFFSKCSEVLGFRKTCDITRKLRKPPDDHSTTNTAILSSSHRSLGVNYSPQHCPSRASNVSDNAGHLYSPEDTLNNDFFYDDEFAVQFDAHLGGMEDEIIDSMELHSLLHMTGDDNQRWRNLTRMSQSKSDTCLYQPELEVSGASDGIISSSERELLSSSDLSDFKAEPLFSPPPPHGDMDDSCSAFHSDSLCNEELAGSLVKEEDRFAFDWTSTKDKYMISFDRSPTKYSSEDSYSEPPYKKASKELTSWGHSNNNSSGSGAACSTGSSTGSRRSSSNILSTSGSGSGISSSGRSVPVSPYLTVNNGNDSGRQSSTDTSTSSTMTTWKIVKQHRRESKESVPEGMTTWKNVRETCMSGSRTVRSKSMPDLQPANHQVQPTEGDTRPKRYSASLLEMYRRLKSCPADVTDYMEPKPCEEPLIQFDVDTWSVSPASSHQMSPTSDFGFKGPSDGSLVKWNTVKNLLDSTDEPPRTKSKNGILDRAVQAGSLLVDSQKRLKGRDTSVQFPPTLAECGVQTSFENSAKVQSKMSKALQTSWELLAGSQWVVRRSLLRNKGANGRRRPHSAGAIPSRFSADDPYTVQLSKQAKQRMTRSLFFNSTALPDLSFLGKNMSSSFVNITQQIGKVPEISDKKKSVKSPEKPLSVSSSASSGYRPKKPPRQQRPRSACLAHSRESSPLLIGAKARSRSSDSASSFCSSSSSGIDPGSHDSLSGRQYMTHHSRRDEKPQPLRSDIKPTATVIVAKDVPQPQKKEYFWQNVSQPRACSPKVCNICQAQSRVSGGERESMAASHPVYLRSGNESDGPLEGPCPCQQSCDCTRVPVECRFTAACSGYMCPTGGLDCTECMPNPRDTTMSKVRLRRPLKSCLAKKGKADRKLLAFKHRSWSDPSDGIVMKYSHEGQIKYQLVTHDKECVRRQPLAEIDLLQDLPPDVKTFQEKFSEESQKTSSPTCSAEAVPVRSPVKNIDGVVLRRKRPMTTPPNSPEQIPVPACTCGTTHAVLHSSSDSGDGTQTCCDIYRSKKSVSFSEEISYHSPYHSPHQSPRRQVRPLVTKDTGTGVIVRHPVNRHLSGPRKQRPVSLPPDFRLIAPQLAGPSIPESPGCDSPPQEFVVSPLSSITLTPSPTDTPSTDIALKKELVHDVMKGTEKLLYYFGQTRDPDQKSELGSSSEYSEVGQLVLEYLCPAVYAIVYDGLKPHVRSLFGKVKNSVWRVVEDSHDTGPSSRVIRDLVQDLKTLDFLTTSWLKFNAFIFGLLNHKALDLWLSHLQSSERLLSKHYDPDGFLRLTSTSAKPLFLDLITVIQPLAQMPFRLEYNFEYRQLEGKQHQQLSDTILDKHVMRGPEGEVDRQHWRLQQQQTQRLHELSQTQRLHELSQSDSPVRGEISPVQGQSGVLHHSAPQVYQPQQVVVWSPTKARWHSLYDKVQTQLTRSELAKQTRNMVADTSKHLLKSLKESKKLRLSKDALQHLGQDLVQVAVGYSSPIKSLPRIPGLTESSDTTTGQSSSHDSTPTDKVKPCSRKALMVFGNQEMLVSTQTSSSDEEKDSDGLLKKVSNLFTSPKKAYKQGVTEYEFHVCRDKESAAKVPDSKIVAYPAQAKGKILHKATSIDSMPDSRRANLTSPTWSQRRSLFDEKGLPRSCSLDQAPVEFQIPSRSDSMESPASGTTSSSNDSQKTITGKKSPEPDRPSAYITRKLGSSLRKSWSSFGPSLVSWMDRLLLEDPGTKQKAKSEENLPTKSPEASIDGLQTRDRPTTGSEDDLDYVQGLLNAGKFGVMEVNSQRAEPEHREKVKVKEPAQEEVNWFVQALCHHVAMQDDQLSFNKGTVLAVIKEEDGDWLLCRHGDKEGLVHRACVTKA